MGLPNQDRGQRSNHALHSRWVARRGPQEEGAKFTETCANVVEAKSVNLILPMACKNDCGIEQIDVDAALVNSDLEDEEIYLDQPHGLEKEDAKNLQTSRALGHKRDGKAMYYG